MKRVLVVLFVCLVAVLNAEKDDSFPEMEKRKSAYMRFGRSDPEMGQDVEKRKSAYMRFGRSDPEMGQDVEKRKSAYMRFGKRSQPQEFEDSDLIDMEKRKSAYMRFGR